MLTPEQELKALREQVTNLQVLANELLEEARAARRQVQVERTIANALEVYARTLLIEIEDLRSK